MKSIVMLASVLIVGWTADRSSADEITVTSREALVRAIQRATPGTRILVAPGTYRGGLQFDRVRGEQGRPIVLAAADPKRPPLFRGGKTAMHWTDAAYLEIRDLAITGATANGINIDDGGSYDTPAHHIVLHGLRIRDIGPQGNRDGIKLSGVDQFRVESCVVERWGSSGSAIDMVGCHDGVIAECTFRFSDSVPANGVQTKGGSSKISIQRCRFEHAGSRAVNIGGSTGPAYFRPRVQGYEAKDIVVEDCTFLGSMAPVAFVGVDGAIVRFNTIYRPTRWVVRILQESRGDRFVPCRNGRFTNNIIAFRTDELNSTVNVGPGTDPTTFAFAKNHWYCVDRPGDSRRGALPTKEVEGTYGIDPQFRDEADGDYRLRASSPVRDAGRRR